MKIFILLIIHIACWIGAIGSFDQFKEEHEKAFPSHNSGYILWAFIFGIVMSGIFLQKLF